MCRVDWSSLHDLSGSDMPPRIRDGMPHPRIQDQLCELIMKHFWPDYIICIVCTVIVSLSYFEVYARLH
jgi:hypothetical protein